ncbi:MAG: hypothetical protein ABL940_13120, partial [Bacteroidia bacterium]
MATIHFNNTARTSVFLLVTIFSLYGLKIKAQEFKQPNFFEKRSSYLFTTEIKKLDTVALRIINNEFGVNKTQLIKGKQYYNFKIGMKLFQFSIINTIIKPTRLIKTESGFTTGDSLQQFGFTVLSGVGKSVDKRFSKFLLSAYLQETNSNYLNNSNNFILVEEKSKREFWKRNFINIGYGAAYANKNNPIFKDNLATGFGYVVETLHYIPIFGGAFIGKTTKDKIEITAWGLSSLLV